MGFSRQEYWSGLPFPSPRDLPESGIEPGSPALQAGDLPTELWGKPFSLLLLLLLLSRFSCVRLCVTPWTAAHQAPPSMGFSRQEYWSGVPLPSLFPLYVPWNNGVRCHDLSCCCCFTFKSALLLFSFTLIKRLFSSSSHFAIRVVSSAYLRLLMYLLL